MAAAEWSRVRIAAGAGELGVPLPIQGKPDETPLHTFFLRNAGRQERSDDWGFGVARGWTAEFAGESLMR